MRSRKYFIFFERFFPLYMISLYRIVAYFKIIFRRCLLSRKRKLSELYFATVGFAGATENAPTNALYHQKEQTFLDANDLTK